MVASYRKIDYRIRPAKSIERKMLSESFRKLNEFGNVSGYRYIGFGSVYFSDFSLFHRSLGMETMISIEDASDKSVKDRFLLNVPYGNVDVRFGNSNIVLQTLEWDQRTIAWLDYDGTMDSRSLEDVQYFTKNCVQGSLLLASFNAGNLEEVPVYDDAGDEISNLSTLDRLKRIVGKFAVPGAISASDLSGWGVGEAYRKIFNEAVTDALKVRNCALSSGARMLYKQLYYFQYADGVKMITIGGIFYDESQAHIVSKCCFDQLSFIKYGGDAYRIDPPNLTYIEMKHIDAGRRRPMVALPLPKSDTDKYEATYRYFPKFVEAEIS